MANTITTAKFILWAARIIGTLILAFFLFFLGAHIFGEDQSGEGFRTTMEFISFLLFPVCTSLGLALALKWEGLGGLVILVSMMAFFVLRPDLLTSFFIIVPAVPGILYIMYWSLKKQELSV